MSRIADRTAHLARYLPAAVAIGAIVVLYLALTGSSSYVLKLRMANADGIRPGSQVTLGGVPIGTIKALDMDGNTVVATLHLKQKGLRIGTGAHDTIVAANLLGEEYIALDPGNPARPLPSGSILPESATVAPTDLDQLVDVLNGSTQARLADLLSESGTAVSGREADLSALLKQIPLSMTDATSLLAQLTQSNDQLSEAIGRADTFVDRVNGSRTDLRAAIDSVSEAATTLAARAGSLRSTVIGAPRTLETLQSFVGKLGNTATQLKPTAVEISNTAPKLNSFLQEVKPFTQSALPTLDEARTVAPTLTNLAEKATPTLKQSLPTLDSLLNIANLAKPLSGWLGLSAPDLFDIPSAWPGALQFRDGIGHIFNGDLYLNPVEVLQIADSGATPAEQRENFSDVKSKSVLDTILASGIKAPAGASSTVTSAPTQTTASSPALPKLPVGGSPSGSSTRTTTTPTQTTPSSTATTALPPALSNAGGQVASTLGNLLHYLVGP